MNILKISFIGAGKVGISFGLYLKKYSYNLLGYYSRSFSSIVNAANITDSTAFKNLGDTIEADIIFITVNDDSIKEVANNISKLNIDYKDKIFVHMSGALSSSELEILKNESSSIISLHPIQTFTDVHTTVEKLKDTVFSIEGDNKGITVIKKVLDKCRNKYFILDKEQKPLYHAGACVVSNYLVTLLDYGFSILKHIGLSEELAINSFSPLIDSSINNIKNLGTKNSLTGPISRGDINTIRKHLDSFEVNDFKNTLLYKELGISTVKLAEGKNLDEKVALQILKLLEEN
ncbi:DUF2520 domain-containing protein [Tissierella sp. DSM 105185]|uniref:DUF2520 domain-containing protein n=1 Tax=Tissierella pigra TaxID=2607614 RepID=A0A6N7XZ00_9FIRM|nr:DUF2520 domain-containing protein [Tissierella pigra]